jgi:hypothetical protein
MSVPIPVIPFNPEAELEKEMESKKGKLGLGDMLNSQDASGTTMYHNLLQGAESSPPNPAALNFLQTVGNKLKEIWNRPIMAPTITKDEHDQLIQGGEGGVHNWQNH